MVETGFSPATTAARCWIRSLTESAPAPETAWYVATTTRRRPASACSACRSGASCIVEQFGFAMIPRCPLSASAFTCETTSGTVGSIRQALELSTTAHPRAAASGARRRLTSAPALKSAISTPLKASGVASATGTCSPRKVTLRPAAEAASGTSLRTGKLRSSRTLIIVRPTRPVAPTTATT